MFCLNILMHSAKGLYASCFHLTFRPIALVPSAGPMPRMYTGRCSENCLYLWVLNWKAAHSRVCPNIAYPPPHYSCPYLNNKQSRIVSGACCTSAVLHRPSLMKPTAYSKDFPYNALFAAFVYRVSFLFSGFGCSVHELQESCSERGESAAWRMMGWIPCAISRKIIGILQHEYLCVEATPDHHRCMFYPLF